MSKARNGQGIALAFDLLVNVWRTAPCFALVIPRHLADFGGLRSQAGLLMIWQR